MIFSKTKSPSPDEDAIRPELIVPCWSILMITVAMLGTGVIFGAWYGFTHPPGAFYLLISDRFFLINGIFESTALAAFLLFLHRHGWRPDDFRVRIGWITTLLGLELLVFTYGGFLAIAEISHFVIWILSPTPDGWVASIFVPRHVPIPKDGFHLSWTVLIIFTVLNAFFEELVYMGYGFNLWAAKYGPRMAVWFTVTARLLVHIYQGSEHLLPIAAWAMIFGVWYRYHRQVWPLIVAHLMVDLISVGLLKVMYGAP